MVFGLFRKGLVRERDAPMADHLVVKHEGGHYHIKLRRRADVRRFTLRVSMASGDIVLTMPEKGDTGAAQRFADAHSGWIRERMRRVPDAVAFEPGAMIPLRGVPHRIVHWTAMRGTVEASTDSNSQPILTVAGDAPHVPRRVTEFLKREARKDLTAAVTRHTETLGIPARSITLRDTRSRWGSCSAAGRLNFSWRLILAPPLVLDYLAAHEVAHLRELNHSSRFWALTHRLCPATDQAEAWLKRHGSSLHRYGQAS